MPSVAIVSAAEPPGHPLAPRLHALRAAGWTARVVSRLPRRRADVVHCSPSVLACARGRAVAGFSGDEDEIEPLLEAAAVHVESAALGELAVRLGVPAGLIAVIPPVPTGAAAVPPSDDGILRVYSTAPLQWASGYEDAFQAIRLLLDTGVRCEYHVPGDGPFLDALEFARYQLGLLDVIALDGEPAGDVFLDPSVVPRSPLDALDALASGRPVLATEPIGPAIVVPRRDPDTIAGALEPLADPEARRALGPEGPRHAARFTAEDQARRYVELYSAAASATSAASSSTVHSSASEEISASSSA